MSISVWCSRALATPLADPGRTTSPPAFSGLLGLVAHAAVGLLVTGRAAPALVPSLGLLAVLGLAYANGANDVSTGVASLVGSGVAGARTAVACGVVCTAAGSLAAAVVSSTLVATFSGGLLAEGQGAFGAPAALAVALGAGTGWLVRWLPRRAPLAVVHWLTSGATSFARGLNDAPKIVALGLGFRVALGPAAPTWLLFVGVALAMAVGGWANGRHVLETLAERVTRLGDAEGVGANLTTAVLVGAASPLGLPVSITHVAGGAILGGAAGGSPGRWGVVGQIGLAWLVTLPAGALLGMLLLRVVQV